MKRSYSSLAEIALLTLIIIRPSLDVFTEYSVSIGPASLNPAGIVSLLIIVLGVFWLWFLPKHSFYLLLKQPFVFILTIWLLLLMPWAVLPFFTLEANKIAGIREWIRLLSYLPIVCLAVHLSMQKSWHVLSGTILLGFIIPALYGLYHIAFNQGMDVRGVQRITGTFVHPNPYAFYLVFITGVAYGLWRMNLRRWPYWLLLVLPIGLLVATFSFTGAAMFAVLAFLSAINEHSQLRVWALVGVVAFVLIFVATPQGRQRIYEVSQVDQLDEIERTGRETSSLTWRLLNWRFLYRQWKLRPVFGYGLGSSTTINPNFNIYEETGHQPHNDYVRFLAETGLIGLLLYLAMLISIGAVLWLARMNAPNSWQQRWAWNALAVYATWLVGSMADNLITATAYQYVLWFGLAAASVLGQNNSFEGESI